MSDEEQVIETRRGDIPESLLVREQKLVDTPDALRLRVLYRLREHPAIGYLRRLQFSHVVRSESGGEWFTCVECTASRETGHVAGCGLAAVLLQSDALTSEVVRIDEAVCWDKTNPFDAAPVPDEVEIEVDIDPATNRGTRVTEKTANLVRTTGSQDAADEFRCWEEYRRPGSDVIVKRSAVVKLKRPPDGAGVGAGDVRPGGNGTL